MKLFLICTLFILYSCAPTVQKSTIKTQKVIETQKEILQEKLKIKDLDKIIVLLDDNIISKKIFFEEFSQSELIGQINKDIKFYYSINEIPKDVINDTIIIGPNTSQDLTLLKKHLGKNNFILSLTNDLSLKKQFADDQIIFLGMSPFFHISKLENQLSKATSIGILYKQNYYGVRLTNYLKEIYQGKYIKSSPYSEEPIDINFAIQELGDLIQYDNIILIDDTSSYKNILTNLSSKQSVYEYDKIFLIDNFSEQRNSISSFYDQVRRADISNIDLSDHKVQHREFFYRASINMAIAIAHEIINTKNFTKIVLTKELGYLEVKNSTINYPIIFK
ncbi:hypothetical protein OAC15_00555 [Alphaproteobacteria bacterium]|nr:hypothetical protein [Alphaproteobacteria bacterium]